MNDTEIIELIQQSILITIQISAPIMIVGLVVGVSIALLQALTQVQEVTLVFVPKILAIFLALFFLFPMMSGILVAFMRELADKMIAGG